MNDGASETAAVSEAFVRFCGRHSRTERTDSMKKRILSVFTAVFLAAAALAGCGNSAAVSGVGIEDETASKATEADSASTGITAAAKPQGKVYKIGINEFNDFTEVDQCREGFFAALAEEGFVEGTNLDVDLRDANADSPTATENAKTLVSNGNDMIFSIGTMAAQTAYEAAGEAKIPVVYAAVSDPVRAGLAKEDGTSVGEATGTADVPAVEEQLQLIRQLMPEAKIIGILHTAAETNSTAEIEAYRELATKYGFEIRTSAVSNPSMIEVSMKALTTMEADCVVMVHDDTLADSISKVLSEAKDADLPVFGATADQVDRGCVAACAVDYVQVGMDAGKMAAKILKGEAKASEISYQQESAYGFYFNTKAARNNDIEIPEDLIRSASEVYDE